MPKPSVAQKLRACQDILNSLKDVLEETLAHARHHNLAPVHILGITNALSANQTVWDNLNVIASRLELTAGPHR